MSRRLALSMRVTEASNYPESRDSISHDWLALCQAWNFDPVLIPNLGDAAAEYFANSEADLLILTGGEDFGSNLIRDETELSMLEAARENGIPVLGVCRGMQVLRLRAT